MKVPFVDLKTQYQNIMDEINNAIQDILNNTSFIGGEVLKLFEKDFSSFCDRKYGIGTSSGTSALYVALLAAGVKPGDEVITVPNTFIATAEVVTQLGATEKFVDVYEDTQLMDTTKIQDVISKKTKAIIPVHLFGQMADMKPIMELAEDNNLKVIEDCAQAHGAMQHNKKSPYDSIGCFSFYPGKNLGAFGDAGMVVTDNEEISKNIRQYINHGRKKGDKYIHSMIGSNYRMDSLQAAVLNVKLKYLNEWTEKRRKNAARYNELLRGIVQTPIEKNYNKHAYHLYVINVKNNIKNRDKLRAYLKEANISSGIHYPIPLHMQPAYANLGYKKGDFPISEKLAENIMSLPMYPELSNEQIEFIVDKIKDFLE